MSIKFLFEDNEQTPSSILLKNSYKGADIYFSNGSSLILSKVKELRKIFNDDIYIFYDLVPDNEVTVKGYTDLVRALKLNYSNVYVLPIICIEYFICISLYKFNRLKLNCTFADELI